MPAMEFAVGSHGTGAHWEPWQNEVQPTFNLVSQVIAASVSIYVREKV